MVVALLELDLDADAAEERRLWAKEEPVDTGLEFRGELGDTAVGVCLACDDEIVSPELHPDRARGAPAFDVEDMRGDGNAHAANLSA